jgi:hypothetical protein
LRVRISRRPVAVAVVLGSTLLACVAVEHLSTTAQKAVVFMPQTTYDFGPVAVGTTTATSPDPYFTIRAQSETDDDYVTSIVLLPTCGSDFALDLQPPLPGSAAHVYCNGNSGGGTGTNIGSSVSDCTYVDYLFGATFKPSSPGFQTCGVQVTTQSASGSGGTTVTNITLTGTGQSASYSMTVTPQTLLDFGDVPLTNQSADQLVEVKNTGSASIDVTASNSDSTHFPSTPAISGVVTIGPGGVQDYMVHCQAGGTPQTYGATFSFSTGGPQGGLSGSVTAACRAITTSVTPVPNPIDFGAHLLGDAATTVQVTITNDSAGPVTLDNFTFANTPGTEVSYNPNPGSVMLTGSGGFTVVNVRYAPTSERDMGPLGTMVFNVEGMPNNVPMRGGAHTGSIGTNPPGLDFGTICAGSTASLDMTIFANAAGDVTLGNPSGPSAPFSVSLPGAGRNLMGHHGSEIILTAMAAPAANAMPGTHMDTVELTTNIPGQMSVPIALHAVVLAGGVAPTPDKAHFGPNNVGKLSSAQMITLTNCGAAALTITDASFSGANADEFTIVSPMDPKVTIQQTQSAMFLVVMSAKSAGPKTGQLVFSYAGGMTAVDLDGTGIGATGGDDNKPRETYYACSTGGGAAGLWPIALAVCAARRRRRRARG